MPFYQLKNAVQATFTRVKFKDVFNLKELYEALKDWLIEYGWGGVESDGKWEGPADEHFEVLYLERIYPAGEKEHWWYWRLQKVPYPNSYIKWHLDIDWHNVMIVPTEVMREGKKLKAHKGEVEIKMWAYLEFDVGNKWSKHPILKLFNKVFPRRIFKKEIYDDHKIELYREVYTMQAYLKKWMKIKSYLPYEEITPFRPSWAFPEWKKE